MHKNQVIKIFPFFPFHRKEEFWLVDSHMHYALCIMQKSAAAIRAANLSLDKCSAANEIICRISENKFKEALSTRSDYDQYS